MQNPRSAAVQLFWMIFGVLAFVATGAAAVHAQDMADQPIVEAALRHLLASEAGRHLLATSRRVCVVYAHDGPRPPAPELLRRLSNDSVPVYGPEACHMDRQRRKLVTTSGEPAIRFSVTPPKRVGADSAQITLGWYSGMVSGETSTCWMGREHERWVVRSCHVDIIL